jgi:hypothetical protein
MGTAQSIVDFWGGMQENDDDQTYATYQCKKIDYMKVDTDQVLFYNYSARDKTTVRDGALFLNENKQSTAIISAPANNNINPILHDLGFENLPEIEYNFNYRVATYGKEFIHEFFFLAIIAGIFFYVKDVKLAIFVSVLLFFTFLEYELSAKHLKISNLNKFFYILIDAVHMFVSLILIYLILNFECNLQKLIILNVMYLILIALFLYFERCCLSILSQNVSEKPDYLWSPHHHRISYFFNLDQSYEKTTVSEKKNATEMWIEGNKGIILSILLLNSYCLWNMNRGGSCVPKVGNGADHFKPVKGMYKRGTRLLSKK